MLGVFKNDVFVLKKQLIVSVVTAAILLALGLLCCGSLRYGNLAKLPINEFDSTYSMLTMIFGLLAAAFIAMENPFSLVTITNRQSGWYNFLYTTPITASKVALVNLLERVGYIVVTSVFFGLPCMLGCYGIAGREVTSTDVFIMLTAVLFAGFTTLLPTSYIVKSANAELFIRIAFIYAAASSLTVIGISLSPPKLEKAINDFVDNLPLICLAMLAADIVLFFISWAISTKMLKKRKL